MPGKIPALWKLFLLIIFTSLLGMACQNEVIFEPVLETAGTCSDGKKNGDETGIDCGGRCYECELVYQPAPCKATLKANVLRFLNTEHAFYGIYVDEFASAYTIKADFRRYGSRYTDFMIVLPEDNAPMQSQVYTLGSSFSWGTYNSGPRAYMELFFDGFDGGTYKSIDKGLLYVEVTDGKVAVDFCELELTTSSGYSLIYSGRITL